MSWYGDPNTCYFRKVMNKNLIRLYKRLLPNWIEHMGKELAGYDSILDIGCGADSIVQRYKIPYSMGVDIHLPYLAQSKAKGIHNDYILADATSLSFQPKSFDAVLASEVMEHLGKEDGQRLLGSMESWARHKVIVKMPNGWVEQDEFDGNPYQEHKSAWSLQELEALGYMITGMSGWKLLRGTQGKVRLWPYFLGDRISDLTQLLVHHRPRHAFQLFGVKSLD